MEGFFFTSNGNKRLSTSDLVTTGRTYSLIVTYSYYNKQITFFLNNVKHGNISFTFSSGNYFVSSGKGLIRYLDKVGVYSQPSLSIQLLSLHLIVFLLAPMLVHLDNLATTLSMTLLVLNLFGKWEKKRKEKIREKERKDFCVALKLDLRKDPHIIEELKKTNQHPITKEEVRYCIFYIFLFSFFFSFSFSFFFFFFLFFFSFLFFSLF